MSAAKFEQIRSKENSQWVPDVNEEEMHKHAHKELHSPDISYRYMILNVL